MNELLTNSQKNAIKDLPIYDVTTTERIDYKEWTRVLSFYRYYVDRFCVECLGMTHLYPFQRLMLRAMATHNNSMLICCRGLTKSYITAIFAVAMAILYPGINIGIVSGTAGQARMIIIQKILGELYKNDNVKREILEYKTSPQDCSVTFHNGSIIRAFSLGVSQQNSSARGWRFQIILVDEARLVKRKVLEEVVIPMTKTRRMANNIAVDKWPDIAKLEEPKMLYMSSAWLKTCELYQTFLEFYNQMSSGNPRYFVCSLDYHVGIQQGLFTQGDIDDAKLTTSSDAFDYEYGAIFVGSANDSFYPYELTFKCRSLEQCELKQPKGSNAIYVVTHDVATSDAKGSDNACTHVIKLIGTSRGTFIKEVVFTQTMNGASLKEQRDLLRELVHIRFPNTEKLVIDVRSAGEGLLPLLEEPWVYEGKEFPPLILDNDDETQALLPDALPMIRGITATVEFNASYYPYMRSCIEDNSLRLLVHSTEVNEDYKNGEYPPEKFLVHVEHDMLMQEMGNIKRTFNDRMQVVYERIVNATKRDRATSLMYGLSVVSEMEKQGKADANRKPIDEEKYLLGYVM